MAENDETKEDTALVIDSLENSPSVSSQNPQNSKVVHTHFFFGVALLLTFALLTDLYNSHQEAQNNRLGEPLTQNQFNSACLETGQLPYANQISNTETNLKIFQGYEGLIDHYDNSVPMYDETYIDVYRVLDTSPLVAEKLDSAQIPEYTNSTFGRDSVGTIKTFTELPIEPGGLNFNDILVIKSKGYATGGFELGFRTEVVELLKVDGPIPYINATTSISNQSGTLVSYVTEIDGRHYGLTIHADGGLILWNRLEMRYATSSLSQNELTTVLSKFRQTDFNSLPIEKKDQKTLNLYCARSQGVNAEKKATTLLPVIKELNSIIARVIDESNRQTVWVTFDDSGLVKEWPLQNIFPPPGEYNNVVWSETLKSDYNLRNSLLPIEIVSDAQNEIAYLHNEKIYQISINKYCSNPKVNPDNVPWRCVALKGIGYIDWPQENTFLLSSLSAPGGVIPNENYLTNLNFYQSIWSQWPNQNRNIYLEGEKYFQNVKLHKDMPESLKMEKVVISNTPTTSSVAEIGSSTRPVITRPPNKPSLYSCTDTDGGKDFAVKGEIHGMNRCIYDGVTQDCDRPPSTKEDVCLPTGLLLEYFCGTDNRITGNSHECPNGCLNGACI